MFGYEWGGKGLDASSQKYRNPLERKDMFIFMNKVDSRDLLLNNVPSKDGWRRQLRLCKWAAGQLWRRYSRSAIQIPCSDKSSGAWFL